MNAEHRCPVCNAELAANAPRGLCPACLLKGGLGTETQTAGGQGKPPQETDFAPPTSAELAPHFPDLEILELVGRGGMGVVYKARQKRLDRLVALKILSPKIGQDQAFAERFTREARAMGMLNHPHIVAVYDFGQTGGEGGPQPPRPPGEGQGSVLPSPSGRGAGGEGANLPSPSGRGAGGEGSLYYFIMEFVDGVNVCQLLDTGKLAPREALAIVPQICEALQYAHDHGVVHRDIKPENVLLNKEGQVKIADFGIAKLVGRDAPNLTLTGAGQIVGTPQYMAPEQIEHPLQVDHRADIYSLGVVFYQMLTGELPIGRFAPPSKKVQIDVRLDEVVLRALEKEPDLRYQQASEVKSHVETIVTTPGAPHDGPNSKEHVWQSPTMGWGHFIGYLYGVTFTSPLAYKTANLSALGFLACLAFLSYLPFPEAHRFMGFSGFSGFFGLIGVAFVMEIIARRKARAAGGESAQWPWALLHCGTQVPSPIFNALMIAGIAVSLLATVYFLAGLQPLLPAESRPVFIPPKREFPPPAKEPDPALVRPRADSPTHRDLNASAAMADPPKLRFLAWQDESQDSSNIRAWHADGTPVTDREELQVLSSVPPTGFRVGHDESQAWRFLHLWFSHPGIDRQSCQGVTLLNAEEKSIPLTRNGSFASSAEPPSANKENLGWIKYTLSPGTVGHTPKTVNIRLEYSVGPWKYDSKIAPDYSGVMTLSEGSVLSGIGQTAAGKAFIGIAEDWSRTATTQYGVVATTVDGRTLDSLGTTRGGLAGGPVGMEQFEFDVPLDQIKEFHFRTRPIKCVEFKDVSLQPGQKTKVQVVVPDAAAVEQATADPLQSPRAAEMRTVVLAALEYATEHPDWPTTLDELKPKYLAEREIDLGQFVYHPMSDESLKMNPQAVVVLSEKEPALAGGQFVGFADGYVEFISDSERLKRLLPAEPKPSQAKQP